MNNFILKHKDIDVSKIVISDDGTRITKEKTINPEHAPLQAAGTLPGLNRWWSQRAVPMTQDGVNAIITNSKAKNNYQFLIQNFSLSLNDGYWVCPEGANYKWKDVNLYTNDFQNFMISNRKDADLPSFSPASSTVGELKKKWIIINNERYLVKGNSSLYAQQSLNEVLISNFHKEQSKENYVAYEPVHLKVLNEEGIGCMSLNFTNENIEFIPAIQVVESEKKCNDVSWYNHYLNICEKHGLNKELLQDFMDYQITSDFLFTNTDRHLSNFGILRDADTLEFLAPAPIFDNGNSLFYKGSSDLKNLDDIHIHSFGSTEYKQLQYVKNRNTIDLAKLPQPDLVEKIYKADPLHKDYIDIVQTGLSKKKEMLEDFIEGKLNINMNKRSNIFVPLDANIQAAADRLKNMQEKQRKLTHPNKESFPEH